MDAALRAVRRGVAAGPPQRQRAVHLPELLAAGPAELETLREVQELSACRRDHRGRAGLPELPPGSCSSCSICGSAGSRIGISQATGTPVCERCRKRWVTCSRCGTGAPLKGGTLREPLCARCLNPDPAFWKRCAVCRVTWQLSTAECTRCSLDRKLKQVFTPPGGTTSPELDRLREAAVRIDRPDLMLDWLKKAGVRRTLQAGALPARDERLTALEQRIAQVIAGRKNPKHQRARHGYAVWHCKCRKFRPWL